MKSSIRNMVLVVFLASALLLSATSANAVCADQSIIYGQTVNGSLSTTDCTDNVSGSSYYADYYLFTGTAGDKISIQLSSTGFDTWLVLYFPSGKFTNKDNSNGGTTQRIPATSGYYTLLESGTYRLEATSYKSNTTGSYTLTLAKEASTTGTLPSAPTNVTATAGDGSATVAFTPGSIGSGTLVNYWASCDKVGDTVSGNSLYGHEVSLPITVTGLTNGTAYYCWGLTRSSVGDSAWSAKSNPVTPTATPAASVPVVEFYNTNLDNYFITADSGEAAAIDGGAAGPGWSRTGNTFTSGGSTSVCRFYGSYSPGPNSHFYTVDPAECQGLKNQQILTGDPRKLTDKSWNFESLDFVSTPPTNQTCPGGTVPVYRAYNNGFIRGVDSNHRITSNLTAIQQQVACGWKNEGVVMCATSGTSSGGTTNCGGGGGGVGQTFTIGSTGGTASYGGVTLTVPQGAFSSATTITIANTSGASNAGYLTPTYNINGFPKSFSKDIPLEFKLSSIPVLEADEKYYVVLGVAAYAKSIPGGVTGHVLIEASLNGNALKAVLPAALGKTASNSPKYSGMSHKQAISVDIVPGEGNLAQVQAEGLIHIYSSAGHFHGFGLKTQRAFITDSLQILEEAYTNLVKLGFNFIENGCRIDASGFIPIQVIFSDLGNPELEGTHMGAWVSGKMGGDPCGTRPFFYDYLELNTRADLKKSSDLRSFRSAIGHELFHFVQRMYTGAPANNLWLSEASSVWFETYFVPTYLDATGTQQDNCPDVQQKNIGFMRGGLFNAALTTSDGKTLPSHGYGASAFLEYMFKKGAVDLPKLWNETKAGKTEYMALLYATNYKLDTLWESFIQDFYKSASGLNCQYSFLSTATDTDTKKVMAPTDLSISFTPINAYPYSGQSYSILIDKTFSSTSPTVVNFKANGLAAKQKIYVYNLSNKQFQLLGELNNATPTYIVNDITQYKNSFIVLMFVDMRVPTNSDENSVENSSNIISITTGIDGDCINDPYTKLCWDTTDTPFYGGPAFVNDAAKYCSDKGTRLPTIDELITFSTAGEIRVAPIDTGVIGWNYLYGSSKDLVPPLKARGFTFMNGLQYSSTAVANLTGYAWHLDLRMGFISYEATGPGTRCVR